MSADKSVRTEGAATIDIEALLLKLLAHWKNGIISDLELGAMVSKIFYDKYLTERGIK